MFMNFLNPLIIPVLNCNLEQKPGGGGQGAWKPEAGNVIGFAFVFRVHESLGRGERYTLNWLWLLMYRGISMRRTTFKDFTTDIN